MKFICQNCGRDFDIGAPKGMQLPCPACGGMLADAESSEESAPAAPAAPAPSAAAFGGAAEEAPADEFSLDAAERFAAKMAAGGTDQAAPPQPAAPPQAPPPQPAAPPQPPPPRPAAPPQPPPPQPQPAPAPPQPPPPAYEEEAQQYGEDEYAQVASEAAYGPEGEYVGEEGYFPEGEEEFEEEAAHPLVLMLGWVLFGVTFVGILVMGYFLKQYYVRATSGAGSPEDKARIQKLEKDLTGQATVLLRHKKDLEKETERADKGAEELRNLRAKTAEYQAASKGATTASKQLQEAHDSNVEALRKAQEELNELRKRAEKAEVAATRGLGRAKGAAHALRAAGFVNRPALWGEAMGHVQAALVADEGLDGAWMLKGRILARLGRGEEAVAAFDRVDQLARKAGAEGHARALVAAGDICRTQLNDDHRATAYYRRASEAAPGSPYGRLGEARKLMLEGNSEAALVKIEEGVRLVEAAGGDATPLKLALAEVLSESDGTRGRALETVSEAIGADPVLVPALDLRARLLAEDGQTDAAAADLARAAELDPANGRRLVELGRALLDLKRPEAAEPVLARAVELMPRSIRALTALARALVRLGKNEDAVVRLAEVLGQDPNNVEAFGLKGEARVALGRFGEGISDLERSLELGPDNAHVRIVLSRAYATSRDSRYRILQRAIEHAQAAVELTGSRDPEALAALAEAHAAKGDYVRATIEMRKALGLEPDNEAYRSLLRAFEKRTR